MRYLSNEVAQATSASTHENVQQEMELYVLIKYRKHPCSLQLSFFEIYEETYIMQDHGTQCYVPLEYSSATAQFMFLMVHMLNLLLTETYRIKNMTKMALKWISYIWIKFFIWSDYDDDDEESVTMFSCRLVHTFECLIMMWTWHYFCSVNAMTLYLCILISTR